VVAGIPARTVPAAPQVVVAPERAPAPVVRPAPTQIQQLAEATTDVLLAGALHQARLLHWDAQKLSLGFETEFAADQVREKMQVLRATLQTLGVGTPAIEIVVGALPKTAEVPGTETLIEVEQRKSDEDREKRKQEALDHPARKLIDEKLGGTWKDPVVDLEKDA
jgi:hypothetical protein